MVCGEQRAGDAGTWRGVDRGEEAKPGRGPPSLVDEGRGFVPRNEEERIWVEAVLHKAQSNEWCVAKRLMEEG